MDLNKLSLFGVLKGQLGWLGRRQEVLAQNIANSDTPNYKPSDLKAFNFQEMVKTQQMQQGRGLKTTSPMHFAGTRSQTSPFAEAQNTAPFETSPNGNAVVLEEQMAKLGETQIQHRLTTELYRKHVNLIKTAIGKGR